VVQLLQFPYVPGICDEIPFPLAKRVAELSSPESRDCSFSRHLSPRRLRFYARRLKARLHMPYLAQFCYALQCNLCRMCKLAAISLRFQCDICYDLPQIAAKFHQVSNMFETSEISRRQNAQKSPLVSTLAIFIASSRQKFY